MAKHPTPLLSYGDPPPDYQHFSKVADVDVAVDFLTTGFSVHVADADAARHVLLRLLNGDQDKVDERMRVAEGPA